MYLNIYNLIGITLLVALISWHIGWSVGWADRRKLEIKRRHNNRYPK